VGGEEELGLLLEPDLSPVIHTLGAVAVLTGAILIGGLITIFADKDKGIRTAYLGKIIFQISP
jgi:ABC-type antimicrobial peptide transport system permease subunit